jgi:3-deoxy-7-phosphoheptulonate synthase
VKNQQPVDGAVDSKPYYNLGTHFLWIGDRTRQLDHAHVEYCRGIVNPIGIKVGPTTDPAELVALIRVLWPEPAAAPGKIVLISRFGASVVSDKLPALIKAVQGAAFAAPIVWTCDPMHGNTRVTSTGLKTREFDDIVAELRYVPPCMCVVCWHRINVAVSACQYLVLCVASLAGIMRQYSPCRLTFEVHRACGSKLGGCHFELTGENVTECTGGPEKLLEHDLPRRYTTYCDPRLNYAQSTCYTLTILKVMMLHRC